MQYTVQGPDGQQHVIEGPDGASDEEVIGQAQKLFSKSSSSSNFPLGDVVKGAVQTALPSSEALNPLQPTTPQTDLMSAIKGGTETALQTIRDPSRISPTVSLPGQALAESKVGQSVADAGSNIGIPTPVSKFVTSALADPQTYLGLEPGSIPKSIQKQLASLGETLTGVDRNSFMELANNPETVLNAQPSSVTGKAFQAAKEAAGVTEADERALATKEGFRRRIYNQVLGEIDDSKTPALRPASKIGDQVLTGDTHKEIAPQAAQIQLEALKQGQNLAPTSGFVDKNGQFMALDDAQKFINDYKGNPFVVEKPDVSVADLLRAKKAGQLMAKSDPSSSGFLYKEINEKINPLLQEMAPDVYAAQQANHLSKVKEAFQNVFPQGSGMYKYIRTLGMLGGSLFHGIGALESPAVAGAATLAGSQAAKIALSPTSLFTGAKALQGYRPFDIPDMQSLRDRLRNKQNANIPIDSIDFKDSKYGHK